MSEPAIPNYLLKRSHSPEELTLFVRRTEHTDLLIDFVRGLAGVEMETTGNGNIIMKQTPHSTMTLKAAAQLHSSLIPLFNPITALTEWDNEEIAAHLNLQMAETIHWVEENEDIDPSMRGMIISRIATLIHAQLNRARGGKERAGIDTHRVEQALQVNDQRKNPGAYPSLPRPGEK